MGNRLDKITIQFTVENNETVIMPVLTRPFLQPLTVILVPAESNRALQLSFRDVEALVTSTMRTLSASTRSSYFRVSRVDYVREMFGPGRTRHIYHTHVVVHFPTQANLQEFFTNSRVVKTVRVDGLEQQRLYVKSGGYSFGVTKSYDVSTALLTHIPSEKAERDKGASSSFNSLLSSATSQFSDPDSPLSKVASKVVSHAASHAASRLFNNNG